MFELPPLPYAKNALEPHITANTLSFHHEKHHQTYVTNLNNLIPNTEYASLSLEEIIVKSAGTSGHPGIFNNSAQVWNHTFYWNCMHTNGGGTPTGALADKIARDFGSFDAFRNDLKQAALTQFGSGWAWLVITAEGKLAITKTGNADCPLVHGQTPLLTIDVWEHAYYLDFQNRRADYAEAFLNHLVNWEFVAANFAKASSQKAA